MRARRNRSQIRSPKKAQLPKGPLTYPRASLKQVGPPWRSPMTGKFCDEADFDTAVSDVEHIVETIEGLRNPLKGAEVREGFGPCGERSVAVPGEGANCTYPECDCYNSETIMLSTGYAEAHQTGEVVSGGKIIYEHED